jgi:cysteine protease ATG4
MQWTPVLVLVPVVLGAGTSLTATYGDALTALLRLPQSVGLVGGPPGASLFLLGHQAQQVRGCLCRGPFCPHPSPPSPNHHSLSLAVVHAPQVFYLDPHDAHTATPDGSSVDVSTYFCDRIRHLPVTALDPSLALGLLCRSRAALDDLCVSLAAAATQHAPCLTAIEHAPPPPALPLHSKDCITLEDDNLGTLEDDQPWELM